MPCCSDSNIKANSTKLPRAFRRHVGSPTKTLLTHCLAVDNVDRQIPQRSSGAGGGTGHCNESRAELAIRLAAMFCGRMAAILPPAGG